MTLGIGTAAGRPRAKHVALFLTLMVFAPALRIAGQTTEPVRPTGHTVRWYEVAAAVGGVALLTTLDEPMQRFTQRHRTTTLDGVADVFRHGGEPVVYAGVSLGMLGVGLATRKPEIQRAGGRVVASVLLSALTSASIKRLSGRSRPNEGVGAFEFHPLTSRKDSAGVEARGTLPSGHTTAAFAVAASLADDIDSPVADILLYSLATGTAWSRINDDRHWFSDAALGAMLGITAAKLVNGRWRIFNLQSPRLLVATTGGTTLSWHMTF